MTEPDDIHWLKEQLIDLQSQLAFQDDVIQALNTVVTRQQQQIEHLNELYNNQKRQLEHISSEVEKEASAVKPPHY